MPRRFTLKSFAKINWMLRVFGKREDTFHEIGTVFQAISLCDEISFEAADDLRLSCDDPSVPTDERNLISRAAARLADTAGKPRGAKIDLRKRIPSPGGLGGGSSNAAVALIGLNRLWNMSLTIDELKNIGASLGSDVPFFFEGGTAIGTGRGEIIETIDDLKAEFLLIVTPDVEVSTAEAFAGLDAPALTKSASESNLSVCRIEASSLDPLRSHLINDFEPSVFARFPEIARVKSTLLELGAVKAAMSGSGASVFAIFDKEETRQTALKSLEHESGWKKFAVSTVSRDEYRESLGF